MFRKTTAAILLLATILLTGCQGKLPQGLDTTQSPSEMQTADLGIDYNEYVVWNGAYAWSELATFVLDDLTVYYIGDDHKCIPICARAQCDHKSKDCSAYLEATDIYAANDRLYYLAYGTEANLGLFSMSLSGIDRRQVNALAPVQDMNNFSYSMRISGDLFALQISLMNADENVKTVYLASLKNNSSLETIFTDLPVGFESVDLWRMTEDWVFAYSKDSDGAYHILGYNILAKKTYDLFVADPTKLGPIYVSKDNFFSWSVLGEGIYRMELGKKPSLVMELPDSLCGAGVFDDQYIYLCNIAAAKFNPTAVPSEEVGLYIYTHSGELINFLPQGDITGIPSYAVSTKDYIYFYDYSAGDPTPAYYLEKEKIGSAELVWMSVKNT